jgi:hypothetical protein
MHVCILTDVGNRNFTPGMYLKDHTWEMVIVRSPILEMFRSLAARNVFDVYLNLCDGFEQDDKDGDYIGLDVVKALGALNLPFTGADSRSYDPSREQMQAVAERHQIGFVRGVNVPAVGEVEALTEGLRYPLMVKHPNSYGSMGMTRKSRVENLQELRTQVRRICDRFGSARVEEFVDGREFTVFVVDNPDDMSDPFVYPPAEVTFPDGEKFLHSHVKWIEYVYLKRVEEKKLIVKLKEMARRMYLAIGGVSYARCDIRMDAKGKLYMLEINPNNGILYKPEDLGPADIMMEYDPQGHGGFLDRIFRSAVIRQRERNLSIKTPGGD